METGQRSPIGGPDVATSRPSAVNAAATLSVVVLAEALDGAPQAAAEVLRTLRAGDEVVLVTRGGTADAAWTDAQDRVRVLRSRSASADVALEQGIATATGELIGIVDDAALGQGGWDGLAPLVWRRVGWVFDAATYRAADVSGERDLVPALRAASEEALGVEDPTSPVACAQAQALLRRALPRLAYAARTTPTEQTFAEPDAEPDAELAAAATDLGAALPLDVLQRAEPDAQAVLTLMACGRRDLAASVAAALLEGVSPAAAHEPAGLDTPERIAALSAEAPRLAERWGRGHPLLVRLAAIATRAARTLVRSQGVARAWPALAALMDLDFLVPPNTEGERALGEDSLLFDAAVRGDRIGAAVEALVPGSGQVLRIVDLGACWQISGIADATLGGLSLSLRVGGKRPTSVTAPVRFGGLDAAGRLRWTATLPTVLPASGTLQFTSRESTRALMLADSRGVPAYVDVAKGPFAVGTRRAAKAGIRRLRSLRAGR